MSADGCSHARAPLAGVDIDGLIAVSTAANARVVRYQTIGEGLIADLKQLAEGRLAARLNNDEQLLVDIGALWKGLEAAVNGGMARLQQEADAAAGDAAQAVEDVASDAEAAAVAPRAA